MGIPKPGIGTNSVGCGKGMGSGGGGMGRIPPGAGTAGGSTIPAIGWTGPPSLGLTNIGGGTATFSSRRRKKRNQINKSAKQSFFSALSSLD